MSGHDRFRVKVVWQSCYKSLEDIDDFRIDTTFLRAPGGAECYVSLRESMQHGFPGILVVVVVAAVVPRV